MLKTHQLINLTFQREKAYLQFVFKNVSEKLKIIMKSMENLKNLCTLKKLHYLPLGISGFNNVLIKSLTLTEEI